MVCLTSVSPDPITLSIKGMTSPQLDLINGEILVPKDGALHVPLNGHQTRWMVHAP